MNRAEDMNLDELVDMLGQLRSLNTKLDEDDTCENSDNENVDTDKVTKERSVEDLLNNLLVQAMVDPSKCTESIHELIEMYKPMLYGICADIFGIMKDLNRNDEWFAENAMYDKKLYVIFWKSRKTIRQIVKLFKVLSISCIFIWYIYISFFEKCIIFFNVNQGNMAYIRDGITSIIVDIGSTRENNAANIMINYLNGKNIKYIDAILITHIHSDHINGIEKLLENIDVGWIIMSIPVEKSNDYLELVKLLKRRKIPIIYIKEEDKITIGNINIDILSPPNSKIIDDDILNANSTVYLIEWNYKYALFMGDATKNTEKYILNKYINDFSIKEKLEKISFYQVAHHGSKTSTFEPFISKINNCNAIISADKSVYGHPDESVVELLKKYYFNVYITEQNGAIKF